jgi:hypothetical protein
MNEIDPPTPQLPPTLPPAARVGELSSPGEDPSERVAIKHVVAAIDAILRHPRRVIFQLEQPGAGKLIAMMLLVAVACSVIYGVVAGTFSGGPQLWNAPVKIAAGLMISALICLPSLYIFTCLSGSRARPKEVCGLLAGLLMLMTILLIGFAPVVWIFSQSTESLAWMGALHLIFWLIATGFGLRFLTTGLSRSQPKSFWGFRAWVVIFLLVTMQMTTSLRPIIGRADTFLPKDKQFFLAHWGDFLGAPNNEAKTGARN